ncbi:MAG: hypothetical protein WDO13_07990 [Verrucomicrobiota bacterium]
MFRTIMTATGLQVEVCRNDPAETLQRCRSDRRRHRLALGFLEMRTAHQFCNHEPMIMEKLAQRARLAFCRGPLCVPYLQSRGIRPDVVSLSPVEIAGKLTEDIQMLPRLADGYRHTFEASLWPEGRFEEACTLS